MPTKKSTKKKILHSQAKYCEGCGKQLHITAKSCPHCGFNKKPKQTPNNKILPIIGLLVNLFIWPGLGTLIGGDVSSGIIQMILMLVGAVLSFILIGIPIVIIVWIWALVSSIKQLSE